MDKNLKSAIRPGIDDTPLGSIYLTLPKWLRVILLLAAIISTSVLLLYPTIRALLMVPILLIFLIIDIIYLIKELKRN
ncbi:hypothetical protein V7O66_03350 [Methanolobus sp. ZRKC3]|uniref:hypothetical protein n=1 Tax=Methanolobus sp. ZRKC3 TaxID=3125786 RepID=UPI00324684F3